MDRPAIGQITCPLCGRVHHAIPLRFGERALCSQCGSRLPLHRHQPGAGLAWTLTALILAIPAVQLPLVIVRKFGAEHASYLWTGVRGLWQNGMPLLSVWVALCGIAVPLALLTTLTMVISAARSPTPVPPTGLWGRLAIAFQHWSMPEVQVLAVLVAFVKIGVLVNVQPGAGLWFYSAMTVAMLFAWRSTALGEGSS